MANVYVTLNELTPNAVNADPTPNSVTTSDTGIIGKVLDGSDEVAAPFKARKLVLRMTSAGAAVVTVAAGDNPPAHGAKYGDLSLALASGTKWVVLEAARYMQDDGTIRFTTATATTTVTAFVLPDSL